LTTDIPVRAAVTLSQPGRPRATSSAGGRDGDTLRQVFTPDAIHDDTVAGGFRGGIEEKIAFLKQALGKVVISQHIVSTTPSTATTRRRRRR
jgi:hypothetical protein